MLDVTLEPHPRTLFPAPVIAIPDQPPAILGALLYQIASRPGTPAAMLSTTAAHLACYIGAPATDLKLGTWEAALPGFAVYLVKQRRRMAAH
jgi:hypothetical protein